MTKICAVIQARTGSTRLSGKVLKPIGKHAALFHTIRRTQAAGFPVVLAIPWLDPSLARLGETMNVPVYRGSMDDVLSRYAGAAEEHEADIIIRITGDCPLVDPDLVRQVVRHIEDGADLSSNVWPWRTYPHGLDVQAFTIDLLRRANREATHPYDREHVCPYMQKIAQKAECVRNPVDLSHHRWTLDTGADYRFFQALAACTIFEPPHPTTAEVLKLLHDAPELMAINREVAHSGYPQP